MPDPVVILKASAAALAVAAAILLLFGKLGRAGWASAAGVGVGFFVGAWLLGVHPHFPLKEDKDRWLLVLLPAAVGVEAAASFLRRLPWLAWPLRLVLAAGAAPVLLYGSVYLSDRGDPSGRKWGPEQTWLILGGMALALATGWALLDRLARRGAGGFAPLVLALACAGSGVTVMLSGYATGGQLGLPLAFALTGAAAASWLLRGPQDLRSAVGIGIVGLFALLVVGRFFGELTTANAVLLFGAPLLGWLAELPSLGRIGPRRRAFAGLSLAGLPVALALVLAVQKPNAVSAPPSAAPGTPEPSVQDYLDFRK
jgi:hypothetical protein